MLRMMSALRGTCIPRAVLHGAHAGQRVHRGAHAADAFAECPGIARVAALQNNLQAAEHGARTHGVVDVIAFVEHRFHAEVPFNSGDGVYYHSLCHGYFTSPVVFSGSTGLPAIFLAPRRAQ